MNKEQSFDGVVSTREIKESQNYHGIRKAVENGSIVRLKNGVYATMEQFAVWSVLRTAQLTLQSSVFCMYDALQDRQIVSFLRPIRKIIQPYKGKNAPLRLNNFYTY